MKNKFFWACLSVITMLAASLGAQAEAGVTLSLNKSELRPGEEAEITVIPSELDHFYAAQLDLGGLEFTGDHTADSNPEGLTFTMMGIKEFTFNAKVPEDAAPGDTFTIGGLYWDDPEKKKSISSEEVTAIGGGDPEAGYMADDTLWVRAVIRTAEKGPIEAVWQKGGEDVTAGGHRVMWEHFYASPKDVNWGSRQNPDIFVKIWFDRSGRVDVNFFHVSVPNIEVYSDYPHDGHPDESGTTTLEARYIRQYYENGRSYMVTNYEDGIAADIGGDWWPSTAAGYSVDDNLDIEAVINTVDAGPIEAVWRKGGGETTAGGHRVIWGHFYASPSDVTWGSEQNPDLFVKIWFDASGRVDVNYFHVSVPDIEVSSYFYDDDGFPQSDTGTAILSDRYIRHEFWKNW